MEFTDEQLPNYFLFTEELDFYGFTEEQCDLAYEMMHSDLQLECARTENEWMIDTDLFDSEQNMQEEGFDGFIIEEYVYIGCMR